MTLNAKPASSHREMGSKNGLILGFTFKGKNIFVN